MDVKRLGFLFGEWVKEMAMEMEMPDKVTEKVGGSYGLGVHSKGADIDALCVGPGFLERTAFFTSFLEKLNAQKEAEDIQASHIMNSLPLKKHNVPLIKLLWDEIEIDPVFAPVIQRSVPDDIVKNMDKHCVRSLDGYRVTEEILMLMLVPNVCNFRSALRAIRLGQMALQGVSPSTFAIISKEIRRGHAICQECTWVRLVESKISLLVASLERNGVVPLVHVHLRSHPGPTKANKEDGKSTMWQIGLEYKVVSKTESTSSNLYEEGMSFSSTYMLGKDFIYIPQPTCQRQEKEKTIPEIQDAS